MIDRGMLDYVLSRIRPQIQADGGDMKVTRIDDDEGVVYVALQGACVDCPLSAVTMSQGIERVVVEHVPGVNHVRPDAEQTKIGDQSLEESLLAGGAGAPGGGMGAGPMGGPMGGMGDDGHRDNPYEDWADDDDDEDEGA
jgi:Fe-S cluster biogenesis protein NfuA